MKNVLFFLAFLVGCSEQCVNYDTQSVDAVMIERKATDTFNFEILLATGPGSIVEKGNTVDLLNEMPYLLSTKIIPSETVINELLSKGINDAGMSGGVKWEPYKLKQGQFSTVVDLLKKANRSLEYVEPPTWVSGAHDWHVWIMYYKSGVPWQKHKELNDEYNCIIAKINEAYDAGNKEEAEELHWKSVEVGTRLAEFVTENLRKN
ncbi:MAG: hypothetical protein HWE11_07215 [Gammaproteobacteria bacterium]|nr:hypothetical protein [Gammaproteobacteria bacterium]